MTAPVTYHPIEPATVYALGATAPGRGPTHVAPVVGPLIARLDAALARAGRPAGEPAIFWYEPVDGTDQLAVHVSYPADPEPHPGEGYYVVELPAVPVAATLVHHGDMSDIGDSWSTLMDRLAADGYRVAGPTREVYLVADGHEPGPGWVTELQVPVERA